jgi:hypothetical protein
MLRAKKPELVEKRLKALFYGQSGAGKTTAAIQFPRPYLIDTERGAENKQYVELLEKAGGVIFQTSNFAELKQEVVSLLTEQHEYKTLIIDPLTIIYNDLIDIAGADETIGTGFGRHVQHANTQIKSLLNLLLRLDMNVIITSHSKTEYGDKLVKLGETYDCYKKLDYLFDLVFEVQKRGEKRVGVVKKSRLEAFHEFDVFPFCYDEIANRYGRDVLERDAVPEILADPAQVAELTRLVDLLKIPTEDTDKWLAKAHAESFADMKGVDVQKCIDYLEKLIKGETK